MSYGRFAAMIATATIVMYGLMYLNTYALDHVAYSQIRLWMAVVMGSVAAFGAALWLVRSQQTVGDLSYMRAMIPHHSIAVMTSERAQIRDPRVRDLADRIIDSQVREIGEMKALIADLERNPVPDGSPTLPSWRDRGAPPPPAK